MRADAKFLPIRKSKDIQEFLEDFYARINVSPNNVEYVEAFGAGTYGRKAHLLNVKSFSVP